MATTQISLTIEEASIEDHPSFHTKRNDWGVIPAHYSTEYDEAGNEIEVWNEEDRSGHLPELDGMSMADMWDFEKKDWAIVLPGMQGITHFLRPIAHGESRCQ